MLDEHHDYQTPLEGTIVGATEVYRTATERAEKIANTATSLNERAGKAGAEVLGLSGATTERASERATANLEVAVNTTSLLTELSKNATEEWIGFTKETAAKNLQQFGRLLQCRTPQEVVSAQSELIRSNLEAWLQFTRRIAENSVRTAEHATRKVAERNSRAA
jgi:hypothetical protein